MSISFLDPRVRPFIRSAILLVVMLAGCGRSGRTPSAGTPQAAGAQRAGGTPSLSFDATPIYRQAGLIARGLPFPIVGRAAYLASSTADTTHVVISLAFASSALTFAREADDRFRANYEVTLVVGRGTDVVARANAEEQVIVGTYRETNRMDETILFQEILDVPPGDYTLAVSVRDRSNQREVDERMQIHVPRLDEGTISSPVPIAEVVPRNGRARLPNLLMNPAGTAVVGRDSIIPFYVESYRQGEAPLRLVIRSESGRVLWSDTVAVSARDGIRSGVIEVPVTRLGLGASRLTLVHDGAADSSSASVFVGFGSELPVASYEDMLSYLRYFASAGRVEKLRQVPEEQRPAAWSEFVRATDGLPATPEHEDLRGYFGRMIRANSRFREEATPGWMVDRGKVFIVLGDPDHIVEPNLNDTQRGRQQMWEYRSLNLQLVFYDQTGAGRWRLTQSSEVRFETEFRRRLR
jgi:GWxTD domain-containing protein